MSKPPFPTRVHPKCRSALQMGNFSVAPIKAAVFLQNTISLRSGATISPSSVNKPHKQLGRTLEGRFATGNQLSVAHDLSVILNHSKPVGRPRRTALRNPREVIAAHEAHAASLSVKLSSMESSTTKDIKTLTVEHMLAIKSIVG